MCLTLHTGKINYDFVLEYIQTENRNNNFISLFNRKFKNRIAITRGGSVAAEAVSMSERQ